jgi:hypothetical protein
VAGFEEPHTKEDWAMLKDPVWGPRIKRTTELVESLWSDVTVDAETEDHAGEPVRESAALAFAAVTAIGQGEFDRFLGNIAGAVRVRQRVLLMRQVETAETRQKPFTEAGDVETFN